MARSTAPEFSKNRVKKAGRAIRMKTSTFHDHKVVENFRASHSHILNAFQASLRNRAKDRDVIVAQRLKRRATIYDKLRRRPNFSLTEMQDIAGCRLIFKKTDELEKFRKTYHKARFNHKLISYKDGKNRFDYITYPKSDGYRGIHDVYEYHSSRDSGAIWNGLRIELQYRTIFQHAWATAVEVAGLLTDNEHKFGRAVKEYESFFCISSELIARFYEDKTSCLPKESTAELISNFKEVDSEIKLMNLFQQYNNVARNVLAIDKNAILIFNKRAPGSEKTKLLRFDSFSNAVKELEKLEDANLREREPYDIVLVRSVNAAGQGSIQSAFRNYFADTRDFVKYMNNIIAG